MDVQPSEPSARALPGRTLGLAAVTLAGCCIGYLGWWLFCQPSVRGRDRTREPTPPEPRLETIAEPSAADRYLSPSELNETLGGGERRAAGRADPRGVVEVEEVEVGGRVRLVGDGGEHSIVEQGRIMIGSTESVLLHRSGGIGVSVGLRSFAIGSGRFQGRVPRAGRIRIGGVSIGGRLAVPTQAEHAFASTGRTDLDIIVRWQADRSLQVVDQLTGAALTAVEVWEVPGTSRRPWVRPAAARIRRGLSSPIRLTPRDRRGTRWVHAPGYTWVRVHDGMDRISLAPAGSVRCRVAWDGALPEGARLQLRVGRLDGGDAQAGRLVRIERAGEVTVPHLAVGRHRVALIHSVGSGPDCILLEREAEVRPGRATALDLELPRAPRQDADSWMGGWIEFAWPWSKQGLWLCIEPLRPGPTLDNLAQLISLGNSGQSFPFRSESRPAGRYRFTVTVGRPIFGSGLSCPVRLTSVVEVDAGKRHALELRVPPPATLLLDLPEREGALPLSWELLDPGPGVLGGTVSDTIDRVGPGYRFLVPQGRVRLRIGGHPLAQEGVTLRVGPGVHRLKL